MPLRRGTKFELPVSSHQETEMLIATEFEGVWFLLASVWFHIGINSEATKSRAGGVREQAVWLFEMFERTPISFQ